MNWSLMFEILRGITEQNNPRVDFLNDGHWIHDGGYWTTVQLDVVHEEEDLTDLFRLKKNARGRAKKDDERKEPFLYTWEVTDQS